MSNSHLADEVSNTRGPKGTIKFIGAVFLAFGWLFIGVFTWRMLPELWAVNTYQQAQAQVQQVSLKHGRKGAFDLDVQYSFPWAGRSIEGHRVTPFMLQSADEAEQWRARLQASADRQEPVAVWVDPTEPNRSMLDRKVGADFLALMLGLPGVFIAIGVWLMFVQVPTTPVPEAPHVANTPTVPSEADASTAHATKSLPTTHPKTRQFLLAFMGLMALFSGFWVYQTWPSDIDAILEPKGSVLPFIQLLFPVMGLAFFIHAQHLLWRLYRRLPAEPSTPVFESTVAMPASAHLTPGALPPGQVASSQTSTRLVILLALLLLAVGAYVKKDALLHWAAAQGWLSLPPMAAEAMPELPPLRPADQRLIDAANQGDVDSVNRALDDGAEVNVFDTSGESALLQAAAHGHLDTVRRLLQRGADLEFTNTIHPHRKGDTALLRAAYRGHSDVFLLLLQSGARTDIKNQWGWTPVHMAAGGDCTPCLDALLSRQLPLDEPARANRGETPFLMAAGQNAPQAMAWLQQHKVDVTAQDAQGYNAMGWARFFKAQASIAWLTEHLPELESTGR